MAEIVILGIFVADAAYRTARMPVAGETILGSGFQLGPGGKGSNQAVAAARAGGDVAFLSRIGEDTFGEMGRTIWAEAGVADWVIADVDRPTGSAAILIDDTSGQNSIVVVPGAAGALSVADVGARADEIARAKVAVTQLEQPVEAAERFLAIARGGDALTLFNPAPAAPLPDGLLALCDYVTPNETEAEALTGVRVTDVASATEAAKALMAQGVRKGAILTLGENGSLHWDGAVATHTPPMRAGDVVDTTGAGDAFNGGLAVALAERREIADALRVATATAALSVTKNGTAASMPDRAEIERVLGRG